MVAAIRECSIVLILSQELHCNKLVHSTSIVKYIVSMERSQDKRARGGFCYCETEVTSVVKQVHSLRAEIRTVEKRCADEVGHLWTRVKQLEAENSMLKARTEGHYPGQGYDSVFERIGTVNTKLHDVQSDIESTAKFTEVSKDTTLKLCKQVNAIINVLRQQNTGADLEPVQWINMHRSDSDASTASSSHTRKTHG